MVRLAETELDGLADGQAELELILAHLHYGVVHERQHAKGVVVLVGRFHRQILVRYEDTVLDEVVAHAQPAERVVVEQHDAVVGAYVERSLADMRRRPARYTEDVYAVVAVIAQWYIIDRTGEIEKF